MDFDAAKKHQAPGLDEEEKKKNTIVEVTVKGARDLRISGQSN